MTQAQSLANALNAQAKSPGFNYSKARAVARRPEFAVDATATKALNDDFNPDVDGCESFVLADGSVCVWQPAQRRYAAKAK